MQGNITVPMKKASQAGFVKKNARFGQFHDNSMAKDAMQKNKDKGKKELHAEQRSSSMATSHAEFEQEVAYIRALQAKTTERQRIMAQLAMELFSALSIQCAVRQWKARKLLWKQKCKRFINQWARYWFFYRRPRHTSKQSIKKFFRACRIVRHFRRIVIIIRTGKRMVKWYHSYREVQAAKKLLI